MADRKIKFVREYINDWNKKEYDIIYDNKICRFVQNSDLPKTVLEFMKTAKVVNQYDVGALRKDKNEVIYK